MLALHSLGKRTSLAPLARPLLIKGLFAAVPADGTIRIGEAERIRLTGAVVDCAAALLETLDPAPLAG